MPDQGQLIRGRFSENLRRARVERGFSQEEFARLADMHRTEVSTLERGRREPRLGTLIKLSGALDVSLDELLEGIGWKPRAPTVTRGQFHVSPAKKTPREGRKA